MKNQMSLAMKLWLNKDKIMGIENEKDNFIVVNTSEADEAEKPLATEEESQETEESEELSEESELAEEGESEELEEEPKETKPKKKNGWLKKLDRKDAEIAALHDRLSKLENPKKDETEKVVELKKPSKDDFETVDQYLEALSEYNAEKKLQAFKKEIADKETKGKVESAFAEKQKTYNEKAEAYSKENPDFQKDLKKDFDEHGKGLTFSPLVNEFLLESDVSPALIHEFAKDRELLEKINGMSQVQASRELVKLEQGLTKPKITTKTTTTAPRPISPSNGKGSIVPKKDINDPNLTQREFETLMDEIEQKRKRA
jgi:hypothetical protein